MNHYFASDIHLGAGGEAFAGETERRFVAWLDDAAKDAESIFLVGDLFDFWFEYREVVPKGFVRTLGKLAELTDRGVRVVTSRTAPDSYQWSMSPSNRMADIMDEKVLPSTTTFRGVLTRMLLARLLRTTLFRKISSGYHDMFSSPSPTVSRPSTGAVNVSRM